MEKIWSLEMENKNIRPEIKEIAETLAAGIIRMKRKQKEKSK
jgi:uncharacterized protein (UPF0335 family)